MTSIPDFLSNSIPLPDTSGLGSFIPIITVLIPFSINRGAHGGFLPTCEHGSRFTYAIAPFGSSIQCCKASASA